MKKFSLTKDEINTLKPIQDKVSRAQIDKDAFTDLFNKKINEEVLPRIGQQNIPQGTGIMIDLVEGVINIKEIEKPNPGVIKRLLSKDKN